MYNEEKTIDLLDSARGVYIPRDFCELKQKQMLKQFGSATIQELSNPENENYWPVWDEVLNGYKEEHDGDTYVLIHDEDLFLVEEKEAKNWEYI